jgi:hypothetical protein
LRYAPIIFVGTLESYDGGTFHFRVEERFRGIRTRTVDVLNTVYEGASGYAGTGEHYLVFADRFKLPERRSVLARTHSHEAVTCRTRLEWTKQLSVLRSWDSSGSART